MLKNFILTHSFKSYCVNSVKTKCSITNTSCCTCKQKTLVHTYVYGSDGAKHVCYLLTENVSRGFLIVPQNKPRHN